MATLFNFILCLWVFCLHLYLCTTWVHGALRGQESVSGPLELEHMPFTGENLPLACPVVTVRALSLAWELFLKNHSNTESGQTLVGRTGSGQTLVGR